MNKAQTAEIARIMLLSAIEVAAAKAGVSVEHMCNVVQAHPTGNAAMFVRKLCGIKA